MDHLTEAGSAVVDTHIKAVERVTQKENIFLFVRKGTHESCALIKTGKFPTKSMDIHDKSSDWGPMSGLVPCDPFFCKKNEGSPKAEKGAERYHAYHHGQERPVHLPAYPELIQKGGMKPFVGYVLQGDRVVILTPGVRNDQAVQKHINRVRGPATSTPLPYQDANVKFYSATKNGRQTDFCVRNNLVNWVRWDDGGKRGGELFPVWVWAYSEGPVTGDYDLWMVAPYWTQWRQHAKAEILKDKHTDKIDRDGSAVTGLIKDLIGKLNAECNRIRMPVFRHGAESQNYGFTQSLDENFLLFTPGGTSMQVKRGEMAKVLADIQNAGYLVYWNKRYGEADSMLGGQTWDKRTVEIDIMRDGKPAKKKFFLIRLKEFLNEARYLGERPTEGGPEVAAARAKANWRHAARSVINRTDPDIRKFYSDLSDLMKEGATTLYHLKEEDFGSEFKLLEAQKRQKLQDLQRRVVDATAATGTGQSDPALFKSVEELFELFDPGGAGEEHSI